MASQHDRLAALALTALLGAWAVVAVWIGLRAEAAATVLFPATIVQTYTGSVAPDIEFRPLHITVVATVAGDGSVRATEGELVALRSLATMGRGPTGPFRFLAARPPTAEHVVDWLANVGVTRGPAAERAAAEAVAVVAAAAAARTRSALHTGAGAGVAADAPLDVPARTPGWVTPLVTVLVLLAGAVPITRRLARFARRA